MDQDSRPRAKTVFQDVCEKHGGNPEPEEPPQPMPGMPFQVVEARPSRFDILKSAANRELDRFAALLGVLGTHLTTSAVIWPVLIIVLKIVMSAIVFGSGISWAHAMVLAFAFWVGAPVAFFLYRYYSGKF